MTICAIAARAQSALPAAKKPQGHDAHVAGRSHRVFADHRPALAHIARPRKNGRVGDYKYRGMESARSHAANGTDAARGWVANAGHSELGLARVRQSRGLLAFCRSFR